VKLDEGKILRLKGEKVAASRGADGKVHTVSPVCTHMGCLVHWNNAERTWDCPCHGSRFHPSGEVLAGPAESPLEKVALAKKPPARQSVAKKAKTAPKKKKAKSRS
jgi:Rieske Fe-S protein